MPFANPAIQAEYQRSRRSGKSGHIIPKPTVKKKRAGNPNWGRPLDSLAPMPVELTAFEKKVVSLDIKPSTYPQSKELKAWAKLNHKTRYIPESLLKAWGLDVEVDY